VENLEYALLERSMTMGAPSLITWLDEHVGKLFDSYCIKDELEVQLDALLEEACDNRKAAAHE
jgi:hypothetical protein